MDYKVWLDWRYNWPSYKVPITHETSDKVFYDNCHPEYGEYMQKEI